MGMAVKFGCGGDNCSVKYVTLVLSTLEFHIFGIWKPFSGSPIVVEPELGMNVRSNMLPVRRDTVNIIKFHFRSNIKRGKLIVSISVTNNVSSYLLKLILK